MIQNRISEKGYMIYPRFLLKMEISDTAKLVYILLLNRMRLSETREEYTDENGRSFVFFTLSALEKETGRKRTTIRDAMNLLKQAGLIEKKPQGQGLADLIYVNIPSDDDDSGEELPCEGADNFSDEVRKSDGERYGNPTGGDTEIRQGEVRKSDRERYGNPTPSKINNKNNNKKRINKRERDRASPRGQYRNVLLSEEEYFALKGSYNMVDEYIERLSSYMRIHGKRYACHDAVLRQWLDKDRQKKNIISYDDCGEVESL